MFWLVDKVKSMIGRNIMVCTSIWSPTNLWLTFFAYWLNLSWNFSLQMFSELFTQNIILYRHDIIKPLSYLITQLYKDHPLVLKSSQNKKLFFGNSPKMICEQFELQVEKNTFWPRHKLEGTFCSAMVPWN